MICSCILGGHQLYHSHYLSFPYLQKMTRHDLKRLPSLLVLVFCRIVLFCCNCHSAPYHSIVPFSLTATGFFEPLALMVSFRQKTAALKSQSRCCANALNSFSDFLVFGLDRYLNFCNKLSDISSNSKVNHRNLFRKTCNLQTMFLNKVY